MHARGGIALEAVQVHVERFRFPRRRPGGAKRCQAIGDFTENSDLYLRISLEDRLALRHHCAIRETEEGSVKTTPPPGARTPRLIACLSEAVEQLFSLPRRCEYFGGRFAHRALPVTAHPPTSGVSF